MAEIIAAQFVATLGIAVLVCVAGTTAIWLLWLAARRWGPRNVRGSARGFPIFITALVTILVGVPVGCGWVYSQTKVIKVVQTVEIPLRSPADRADLIALFRRQAAADGMIFTDATESWRTNPPPGSRKTLYIALDRPVDRPVGPKQDWEVIAEDEGAGTDPWLTFYEGPDPARGNDTRRRLIAAVRARFPNALDVPIAPSGALPLREDLERVGMAYRIRADRAATYEADARTR